MFTLRNLPTVESRQVLSTDFTLASIKDLPTALRSSIPRCGEIATWPSRISVSQSVCLAFWKKQSFKAAVCLRSPFHTIIHTDPVAVLK